MKKAEMFSYMLFGITLFAAVIMFHFWGMSIMTAVLAMLCGMSFTCCYMFHELKED